MKFIPFSCHTLILAGFVMASATCLHGAQAEADPLPTPHVFAIAAGKMDDAVHALPALLGPPKDNEEQYFIDHNYLIVGTRDDQMSRLEKGLHPYLESTSETPPFDLEIRNGSIIENGKPVTEAIIGRLLDYLNRKGLKYNIILKPGVAGVKINDLVLHQPEFNNIGLFEAVAQSTPNLALSGGDGPSTLYFNGIGGNQVGTRVFNLTNYLNPDGKADEKTIHEKLNGLTDIIFKTLTDLDPGFSDATQPHYQFHQGTNLLVVISQERFLDVVSQIINALTERPAYENQLELFAPRAAQPGKTIEDIATLLNNADTNKTVADGSRRAPDLSALYNLFAQMRNLQDGTPGKPLSPQEIQDFETQMNEWRKMLSELQKLLPKENPPATSSP